MLRRFKRAFLLATLTSVIVMALVFIVVKAGSLTPTVPVGTGSMRSLLEIYNVLADPTYSSGQAAAINGNILQQLKYISGMTLQNIYNNSGATPTIAGLVSNNNTVLTIKRSSVNAGNIFELQNATSAVFSVDKDGKIAGAAGQIKAASGSVFYNAGGYAIAATGEEILRASIPIFGYDFPARYANSTTPIKISRDITLEAGSFPVVPTGVNRRYKFKIQYSNNLAAGNSSWQIINETTPGDVYAPFTVVNTGIASIEESKVYHTPAITALPAAGQKWYLQVTAPVGTIIQIYQIELLAYDVLL